MRNRTSTSVGAALLLTLMAVATANTGADPRVTRGRMFEAPAPETFNMSGPYTGVLTGEIMLGEVTYRLAPNVQVYEIGRGPMPMGTVVNDRHVFLMGTRSGDSELITNVIIRPAEDASAAHGELQGHVQPAGAPE